jgi:hypothetical protein
MANAPLNAHEVLALARKLAREEQIRLAKLLLRDAVSDDAIAYGAESPNDDEFGSDDEALAWEGDGWEEFYAPR